MADKKAPKAKKSDDISNLPLDQQLSQKRADLLTAQKGLYDGTLQNPHAIKNLKKDIARICTKINEEKGEK